MFPAPLSLAGLPDEELIDAQRRWLAYGAELQAEMARRLRAGAERRATALELAREQQLLSASEYASEVGLDRSTPHRWRAALGLPARLTRARWAEARRQYAARKDEG